MAARVRPTQVCNELNTQIKVLSARVKTMERQLAKMEELTQLMTVKNIACMLASGAPNMVAAAAIISSDPTLLLQIAGATSAQALLDALPGVPWQTFNANLTLENLTMPAFDIPGFPQPAAGSPADLQNRISECKTLAMHFS